MKKRLFCWLWITMTVMLLISGCGRVTQENMPTSIVTATPDVTLPPAEQEMERPEKKEIIVYVTRTGKKYHRGWCGYLHSSKIALPLDKAIELDYTACSRCF